jgi:hypothetical protein
LALAGAEAESSIGIFEYITVAVSIVLSLGLVRLLEGSLNAFQRSRIYPIHAIWIVLTFNQHFSYWWQMWRYRGDVDWSYPRFVLQAIPALILYLVATVLVTAAPRQVTSWREHYYSIAPVLFGLNASLVVVSLLLPRLTVGTTPSFILIITFPVLFGLVAGAISKNPRLHGALAASYLVLSVVIALTTISSPLSPLKAR